MGTDFDVVLAADVLEHLRDPGALLRRAAQSILAPSGVVMASIPNVAHWYPAAADAVGPVRLRAPRHLRRRPPPLLHPAQLRAHGATIRIMRVRRRAITGLPVEVTDRGTEAPQWVKQSISVTDRTGMVLWPNLFAYQLLYELEPS